jgi:hypothetical protein
LSASSSLDEELLEEPPPPPPPPPAPPFAEAADVLDVEADDVDDEPPDALFVALFVALFAELAALLLFAFDDDAPEEALPLVVFADVCAFVPALPVPLP